MTDFQPMIGTLVLVDTQQLFFGCRDAYGPTMRTDFKKLREMVQGQLADDPPHSWADFQAYIMAYPNYDVSKFESMLKKFEFHVKVKYMPTYDATVVRSGSKENSCSRSIIADAIIKKDIYKRFVFVTGEGGILSAVRTLKDLDKEIWVVAFPGSLNQSLAAEADRTILLTEQVVWTKAREDVLKAKRDNSGE